MRARRAAFSLMLVVLLAAATMLLRPAPVVQATEPEAVSLPPVCGEKLPLPSEYEFRKSEYQLLLGRFMAAECYKQLGWAHDVQIRPSGPTIATLGTSTSDPHLPAWVSQSWAVHGSVLVYYSPDVYRWMCERDAAGEREFVAECRETCPACKLDGKDGKDGKDGIRPIADGEMVVKLMYGTTTEEMLRDPSPAGCQSCHMPTSYPGVDGTLETRIASIQEASNMPQTENRLPMSDIDLKPRQPFSRHALVGLNVFFNKIAQQFPDILGIRIQDPMLVSRGVAPLATTYNSMIQQADNETATVAVTGIEMNGSRLEAQVQVRNLAGHKLPSGVGFRRLFIELSVLDADGQPIWVSGRTSPTGTIVDENGQLVKGEFFWRSGCEPMTVAEQKDWFQPHYETIASQDQVQIYQELERDPRGKLTTSFLGLAHDLKDNRLLPRGWDPSVERARKAGLGSSKLSAEDLVHDILPKLPSTTGGQVRDPYYLPRSQGGLGGGGDALTYTIPLADLKGRHPATVQARLFYQAMPPYFLQDRFCTAPEKPDTSRLFFLTGHLDLSGTRAEGWKLLVVSSGAVAVAVAVPGSRVSSEQGEERTNRSPSGAR
jgi:hypothetical protein